MDWFTYYTLLLISFPLLVWGKSYSLRCFFHSAYGDTLLYDHKRKLTLWCSILINLIVLYPLTDAASLAGGVGFWGGVVLFVSGAIYQASMWFLLEYFVFLKDF